MPAAPAEISLFIFGTNCPVCQVWHLLLPDRIGRYLALANITFLAATPPCYCPPQLFSVLLLKYFDVLNILLPFLFCAYILQPICLAMHEFFTLTCATSHIYLSIFTLWLFHFHFSISTFQFPHDYFSPFTFQFSLSNFNIIIFHIHFSIAPSHNERGCSWKNPEPTPGRWKPILRDNMSEKVEWQKYKVPYWESTSSVRLQKAA